MRHTVRDTAWSIAPLRILLIANRHRYKVKREKSAFYIYSSSAIVYSCGRLAYPVCFHERTGFHDPLNGFIWSINESHISAANAALHGQLVPVGVGLVPARMCDSCAPRIRAFWPPNLSDRPSHDVSGHQFRRTSSLPNLQTGPIQPHRSESWSHFCCIGGKRVHTKVSARARAKLRFANLWLGSRSNWCTGNYVNCVRMRAYRSKGNNNKW